MKQEIERELDSLLEEPVTLQYFKSNVGTKMFCPVCDEILDYRHSTELSTYVNDKLTRCFIVCDTCADRALTPDTLKRLVAAADPDVPQRMEIYRGRKPSVVSIVTLSQGSTS